MHKYILKDSDGNKYHLNADSAADALIIASLHWLGKQFRVVI